jgi:hypothetical protein
MCAQTPKRGEAPMHCSLKLLDSRTVSAGTMPSAKIFCLLYTSLINRFRARLRCSRPRRTLAHSRAVMTRGNEIEGPGAVDIARFAVDREGDPHLADRDFRRARRAARSSSAARLSSFTAGPGHLPRRGLFA